jgi:Tol biopolymer transport system component
LGYHSPGVGFNTDLTTRGAYATGVLRWCLIAVALAGCDLVFTVDVEDGCQLAWENGPLALSPPRLISELADPASQFWPSLTADGNTLYFARDSGDQTRDLYVATRDGAGAPWSTPVRVEELATAGDEQRITVDASGTIAVFAANRDGSTDLYYTTRAGAESPFGEPTRMHFDDVNDAFNGDFDPELSFDGTRLFYAPYTGAQQYVRITSRSTIDQPFGPPTDVGGIAVTDESGDPTLSRDERILVYATGDLSSENDIYYTVRDSPAAAFGPPTQVPGANVVDFDDSETELSPDACELLFASTRDGRYQLYVTEVVR